MILHYLKLAYRNFRVNKIIFFGSIITLFLGVSCTVLLLLYIRNELTMNRFHKAAKNIYLVQGQITPDSKPEAMSPTFSNIDLNPENYPEIAHVVTLGKYDLQIGINETIFLENGLVASNNFFDVFDFELLSGDKQTALSAPDNILISERFSEKHFGDKVAVGEKVLINTSQGNKVYTVAGILENPPSNSSIDFDFIIAQDRKRYSSSEIDFLVLQKKIDEAEFANKIENLIQAHPNIRHKEYKLSLLPLNEVYFSDSPVESHWSLQPIFTRYGNSQSIRIFIVIIFIILFMSALNFSNFQVINVNATLKNIGLIKLFGAGKKSFFLQKLCEIIIFSGITSVLILFACYLALPLFNKLVDTEISMDITYILLAGFGILFILSAISIIYPMVINARLPIAFGLKKTFFQGKNISGRKTVVAIQFAMTFVLLISTMVAYKQLNMMLNKDVGFNTENIITTNFISDNKIDRDTLTINQQYIKDELARIPSISSFSQGNTLFDSYTKGGWKKLGDPNDFKDMRQLMILPESFKIFDLKLTEGRFFKYDEQDAYYIVINEAAKKYFGFDTLADAKLEKEGFHPDYGGILQIVGVVKDFNFEHLSKAPQPLIIQLSG
ncbi:MAG TPA: ABC transporter permease, partial [Draconibacterium sp.]|nr:ABC transporter permease [Draconibacterium sp.]